MRSVYADESLSEVGATNDSPCETILACPFLKKAKQQQQQQQP